MYKPLPNYLTVRNSKIEGLGLFATQIIQKGTDLGISHIPDEDYENDYIRTPLGGFLNHSNNPNVIKMDEVDPDTLSAMGRLHLIAMRDIMDGEEITVKYTLYDVGS
jgi:SET domain-containing protein|tara:strand:- start:719 stop:1039 length:321 start_codon:yes stop_codon:yes gene_type:complete